MNLVLHIPVWLCWLLGIPVCLFVLVGVFIAVVLILNPSAMLR